MGILDLFKTNKGKGNSLDEMKREIKKTSSELREVSEELKSHLERIEKFNNGNFKDWMNQLLEAYEKKRAEINQAAQAVAQFKPGEVKDEEFEKQVEIANKNLGAMNAVMEMDLMHANAQMQEFNKFFGEVNQSMNKSIQLLETLPVLADKLNQLEAKIDEVNPSVQQD